MCVFPKKIHRTIVKYKIFRTFASDKAGPYTGRGGSKIHIGKRLNGYKTHEGLGKAFTNVILCTIKLRNLDSSYRDNATERLRG